MVKICKRKINTTTLIKTFFGAGLLLAAFNSWATYETAYTEMVYDMTGSPSSYLLQTELYSPAGSSTTDSCTDGSASRMLLPSPGLKAGQRSDVGHINYQGPLCGGASNSSYVRIHGMLLDVISKAKVVDFYATLNVSNTLSLDSTARFTSCSISDSTSTPHKPVSVVATNSGASSSQIAVYSLTTGPSTISCSDDVIPAVRKPNN